MAGRSAGLGCAGCAQQGAGYRRAAAVPAVRRVGPQQGHPDGPHHQQTTGTQRDRTPQQSPAPPPPRPGAGTLLRSCGVLKFISQWVVRVEAAVHWVRVNAFSAESSPKLTWDAMGLRADSARPQRVSGSARTDSQRAESARNPIAANVKFSD